MEEFTQSESERPMTISRQGEIKIFSNIIIKYKQRHTQSCVPSHHRSNTEPKKHAGLLYAWTSVPVRAPGVYPQAYQDNPSVSGPPQLSPVFPNPSRTSPVSLETRPLQASRVIPESRRLPASMVSLVRSATGALHVLIILGEPHWVQTTGN